LSKIHSYRLLFQKKTKKLSGIDDSACISRNLISRIRGKFAKIAVKVLYSYKNAFVSPFQGFGYH